MAVSFACPSCGTTFTATGTAGPVPCPRCGFLVDISHQLPAAEGMIAPALPAGAGLGMEMRPRPSAPAAPAAIPSDDAAGPLPALAPADETTIERFGDYELIGEMGKSDIAILYRARQIQTRHIVALKVLVGGTGFSESVIEALHAAGSKGMGLSHPNIAELIDSGMSDGIPYLASEYVEGRALGKFLSERGLQPFETMVIVQSLALALDHAHAERVYHGNIKPNNVIIDNFMNPKLTDFGLARLPTSEKLAAAGGGAGAMAFYGPFYSAPEQLMDEGSLEARSDVYGLGALAYHVLTGRPPFVAEDLVTLVKRINSSPPRPPRSIRSRIPPEASSIVMKCLEKEPDDRYPDAAEVADEIDRMLSRKPVRAMARAKSHRFLRRLWRRKAGVFAVLLVSAFAGLAGYQLSVRSSGEARGGGRDAAIALLQKGKKALEARRYKEAAEVLRSVSGRLKGDRAVDCFLHLGRALELDGKASEAAGEFARAIVRAPEVPDYYAYRGIAYYKAGEYRQAIEDFREELRRRKAGDPKQSDTRYRMGVALMGAGDYLQARNYLQAALEYKPGDEDIKRALDKVKSLVR